MKKVVRLVMLLTIILPLFWVKTDQAQAETETVAVTLHKLVFPENGMPQESENTGEERLKEYPGLNGVTFDVYDVTKDFYQALAESQTKDLKEIQRQLQGMDLSKRQFVAQQTTATVNGEDGIAKFDLSKLTGDGENAVYLFRESAAPSDVKSKAADMVLALPLFDEKGAALIEPIHLYPKNEIVQQPFEKRIVDAKDSYQLGDQINYHLTTTLPSSLSMYYKYLISDHADNSLLLDPQSIKVEIGGNIFSGYQLETAQNSFKLNFDLEQLKPYAGKTVSVKYTMTLDSQERVDVDIINTAELETNFDKITRKKTVKTGGKKFVKVDVAKRDATLAGAEFLVKNQQDEYLQMSGKTYHWTKDKGNSALVKLISSNEGVFEIKGLRYGKYRLEEIKAPLGYVLSKSDISFEVSENSYTFSDGILPVVNQRDTVETKGSGQRTGSQRVNTALPQTKQPSASSSTRSQLPKTNMLKNLSMIIAGCLILILIVSIIVTRRKKLKG